MLHVRGCSDACGDRLWQFFGDETDRGKHFCMWGWCARNFPELVAAVAQAVNICYPILNGQPCRASRFLGLSQKSPVVIWARELLSESDSISTLGYSVLNKLFFNKKLKQIPIIFIINEIKYYIILIIIHF